MTLGRTVEILLAEDNPGDCRLTAEAFRSAKLENRLHVVPDGEEALAFLRRQGRYADAPRADLVLLDLNLPGKDGRRVLTELKSDPDLRHIPVIVFTVSSSDHDVADSYDHYANCYITKPDTLESFVRVLRSIDDFWLTFVKFPRDSEPTLP